MPERGTSLPLAFLPRVATLEVSRWHQIRLKRLLGNTQIHEQRNNLVLLTTEKDAARIKGDATLSELAAKTRALPVSLAVKESADFRKLVLGACNRA